MTRPFRSFSSSLFAVVLFLASGASAQSPGTNVAEIIFDKIPQQHGLGYDAYGVDCGPVTLGGKECDAWGAER